jgi:predicted nucleic acid-binding protein
MTEALVDTDILSELIRERNARVAAHARESITRSGPLAISVVTVMELAKGLEKAGRANVLDSYLARLRPLQVLKFAAEEARLAGIIRRARTNWSLNRQSRPDDRGDGPRARSDVGHGQREPL